MVDAPRVLRLLRRIRDELAALRRLAERSDADLLADEDALPAAKYRLVVAVEAAIDVADHVIASEGLTPANTFAESFESLGAGGWIDAVLADALADAARFRNLLVHQYAEVDDNRVLEIVRTRLDDLDVYVATIAARVT